MPIEPTRPEFRPDPALDRAEMESLQRAIAAEAMFTDDETFQSDSKALTIVGVDQSFLEDRVISAIVAFEAGAVVERTHAVSPLSIPYIPGLLAFREGGPICEAFATLSCTPDLALFDGSGRIHYRQAGLATHIGVIYDLPSIGVAKSLLCGAPAEPVADRPAGWRAPIHADANVDAPDGTTIGYAVQSKQYNHDASTSINPLYVSPGHRVGAKTAADVVEALCAGYKLPEPTRAADRYADEVKRNLC